MISRNQIPVISSICRQVFPELSHIFAINLFITELCFFLFKIINATSLQQPRPTDEHLEYSFLRLYTNNCVLKLLICTFFRQEACIMSRLNHPSLIQLLGVVIRPERFIVMELAPFGSFDSVTETRGHQPRVIIHRIAIQVYLF